MRTPLFPVLGIIFLGAAVPALGQRLPIKPAATKLNLVGKVTAAVTRAERFVLPNFDLTNPTNLAITLSNSPQKKLLNNHTSYVQDNAQAFRALTALRAHVIFPQNTPPTHIVNQLRTFIKDPYLMKQIDQNISRNNYAGAMWDLTDFYSLLITPRPFNHMSHSVKHIGFTEDVFVDTTLDYLNRHPHKVPLRLREMLKAPSIGSKYKKTVNGFLREPTPFSPLAKSGFSETLHDIYTEYSLLLDEAYQSPEVRITISFYNQALNELEDFVAVHHRAPRWDGPMEERKLYNQLAIITRDNPYNHFTEALYPLQEIKNILRQNPTILYSWQSTLQHIEEFIQKNGFYPRSYNATNGNTTEEELQILDHVTHHINTNPLLYSDLKKLKIKYNIPLD